MDTKLTTSFSVAAFLLSCLAIFIAVQVHAPAAKVGGTTNYDTISVSGFQIGAGCNNGFGVCTGSLVSQANFGQCFIQAASQTIAASSTQTVDCQAGTAGINSPLAGITAGGGVQVTLGTTSPTLYEGLQIRNASASSTPGYITLNIYNGTGASFTWTAAASSSPIYQFTHG